MRKLSFLKMAGGLLIGGLALNACVDDKYTFDDLDKTMKFGEGTITLPASSTGDIEFSNLFEINEGGAITMEADPNGRKDNNGNLLDSIYYLNSSGNTSSTRLDVDEIRITVNDPDPIVVSPTRQTSIPTFLARHLAPSQTPGAIYYNFWNIPEATREIDRVSSNPISSDVISIEEITFDQAKGKESGIKLTLSLSGVGIIKEIKFESLQFQLPSGLAIKDATYTATNKNGDINTTNGSYDDATGWLTFFGPDMEKDKGLDINKDAIVELTFKKGIIGSDQALQFNNHIASFGGNITVRGYLSVEMGTASETAFPTNVTFKTTIKFLNDGALNINQFSGKIQHTLSKIAPIKINDLPDFLTDPKVRLNLYNPQIYLKLTLKGVRQRITTDIALTSFEDDECTKQIGRVEIPKLQLKGDTLGGQNDMLQWLYAKEDDKQSIPKEFNEYKPIKDSLLVSNLPNLLNKVPHTIKVGGTKNDNLVVNVTCKDVHLPINCPVDLDYKIYAPLAFDTGFKIVYTSEESNFDLGDDMDQIDFGQILITGRAESDIPMDLSLSAKALSNEKDIQKDEFIDIPQMVITWQEGTMNANGEIEYLKNPTKALPLKAATLNEGSIQKTSTYFRLILTPVDGITMSDILAGNKEKGVKQLDGLSYTATMDNPIPGQSLKTSQHLKLTDLKISLVGGITYTEKDK